MNQFNSFFRIFALLILKVVGYLNYVIPKNKKTILLYSNNKDYNDNNYALLHKLIELGFNEEYRIIQSVADYKENQLKAKNLFYCPVYLAPLIFLRTKFVFYDGGTVKITPTRKQVVITLWHGIPLKKIGLLLDKKNTFLEKYNQFTKIVSPHENLTSIFADSFGCDKSRVLISGYPRNDYLFNTNEDVLEKIGIDRKLYRHILLWMPTYRKTITGSHSDSKLFESEIPLSTIHNINNLQNLAKLLEEKNILLVIKPHPYCILNNQDITSDYSHIKQITNSDLNRHNIVNYSFVALFDGLITDYSSILFDYLLLDKPIAFTIEDLEQYKDTRGMNFPDPLELMAGDHLSNFDDMYRYIESFDGIIKNEYKDKTQSLRNKFHYIQDDTATETLLNLIGLKK